MADWDEVFAKKGKVFYTPQEDMKSISSLFKKKDFHSVLDLGCGTGRHAVMLSKAGFKVTGVDISRSGLMQSKAWLKSLGLKAKFYQASCFKRLPFDDDSFDAIISIQVVHHNTHDNVKKAIAEIYRVLKKSGLAFITVSVKRNGFRSSMSKKIAPNTYVPLDGDEKGLIHFIYTKRLLIGDLKSFKIMNIHRDSHSHYCVLLQK